MIKYLVVALGNYEEKYFFTRHNAGFLILDSFAATNNLKWEFNKKINCDICLFENYILCKPKTYMNITGGCVLSALKYFNILPENLLVIHDDVDFDLGVVKIQKNASAGGHHGVLSVINSLQTQNFTRMRVGVGRPPLNPNDVVNWVLSKFSTLELKTIQNLNLPLDKAFSK